MAGHHRGRPRRTQARQERWLARLGAAATGDEQLDIAFDWFRASARRSPDRAALMREVAQYLAGKATAIDGRT